MEVRSSSQCKTASLFVSLYKVQINRSQVKDLRKVLLICGLDVSVNGNVCVLVSRVVFCCFGFAPFLWKTCFSLYTKCVVFLFF